MSNWKKWYDEYIYCKSIPLSYDIGDIKDGKTVKSILYTKIGHQYNEWTVSYEWV